MKRIGIACIALLCAATLSYGGPNAGGTIILHWNSAPIPWTSDPAYFEGGLTSCAGAGTQAPPATTFPPPVNQRVVWFAYASFPPNSSPRLKALAFGIDYTLFSGSSGVHIDWSVTRPGSTEAPTTTPQWPLPNSGNSIVFANTLTSFLDEIYVFAGYGTQGQIFSLRPHPTIPSQFADDAIPPNLDRIEGYGTLGFGVPGVPICANVTGACCYPDCSCLLVTQDQCPTGDWRPGFACVPNPCPCPLGACCRSDGTCQFQTRAACESSGGFWGGPGTSCDPNPCAGACCYPDGHCQFVVEPACPTGDWQLNLPCDPNPCVGLGACCFPDCHCEVLTEDQCPTSVWMPGVLCEPSPCDCPPGACCYPDGSCTEVPPFLCTGVYHSGELCTPNPCPQPGACCYPDCTCQFVLQDDCPTGDWHQLTPCVPNPCSCGAGACCYPDGHCELVPQADCPTGDWRSGVPCDPNPCPPPHGACCFDSGECQFLTPDECGAQGGAYVGDGVPCSPGLCLPFPVEQNSWGRIKAHYR